MTNDEFYVHTDIPPGVTIDEYRRARPRGTKSLRRLLAVGSRRSSKRKKGLGQAS